MAAVTLLGTEVFNTTSGTKTVTATPAVDDLIVLVVAHTGNTSAAAPTDNNSDGLGTYTLSQSNVKNGSADTLAIWIRDANIGSASSTIFTHAPGASTGGGLAVHKVTGMARAGASAEKQSAGQSNQAAAGTPTLTFGSTLTTSNAFIGAVFNASNAASVTPPAGATERVDTGYNTPASGLETCSANSLLGVTSVPWGGTSASAFCCVGVELDTSAAPVSPMSFGFIF